MRCGCLGAGGKAGDWPTAGKHLKAQQASADPSSGATGALGGLPACISTLPVQVTQARSSPCQARRVQPQLTHPPFPFPSTPHPAIYIHPSSSARLPQYRSRHRCRLASPSAKQLRQHQLHGLGSCRSAGRTQYSQWYAFVNLKVLRIRGLSLSLHQRQAEQSANHRHRRSPSRAPSSPTRVRPKPPTAPSMIATAAVAVAAATSTRGAAGRACARLASLSGPSSQLPPSSS